MSMDVAALDTISATTKSMEGLSMDFCKLGGTMSSLPGVGEVLGDAKEAVAGKLTKLSSATKELMDVKEELAEPVSIISRITALAAKAQALYESVTEAVMAKINALSAKISAAVEWIKEKINSVISSIVGLATSAFNKLSSMVSGLKDQALSFANVSSASQCPSMTASLEAAGTSVTAALADQAGAVTGILGDATEDTDGDEWDSIPDKLADAKAAASSVPSMLADIDLDELAEIEASLPAFDG